MQELLLCEEFHFLVVGRKKECLEIGVCVVMRVDVCVCVWCGAWCVVWWDVVCACVDACVY